MYAGIPTHTALNLIGKHITQYKHKSNGSYTVDAIREGLRLVMTMNTFTFGVLTFKQLNGTAMGTPPAPPYATVYYGIHEEKFLPKYSQCIVFYRRFIDDVISIWCPNQNSKVDDTEWNSFIKTMNAFPGLTWEFSEQSKTVDFMDMTIAINNSNKIETTIFEKKMNLHLYIPPHSAHPRGYSRELYTAHSFESSLFVRQRMTKSTIQKFSSSDSLPMDTKEATRSAAYSTKQ